MASRPAAALGLRLTPSWDLLSPPFCDGPPVPGSCAFLLHGLHYCAIGTGSLGAAWYEIQGRQLFETSNI